MKQKPSSVCVRKSSKKRSSVDSGFYLPESDVLRLFNTFRTNVHTKPDNIKMLSLNKKGNVLQVHFLPISSDFLDTFNTICHLKMKEYFLCSLKKSHSKNISSGSIRKFKKYLLKTLKKPNFSALNLECDDIDFIIFQLLHNDEEILQDKVLLRNVFLKSINEFYRHLHKSKHYRVILSVLRLLNMLSLNCYEFLQSQVNFEFLLEITGTMEKYIFNFPFNDDNPLFMFLAFGFFLNLSNGYYNLPHLFKQLCTEFDLMDMIRVIRCCLIHHKKYNSMYIGMMIIKSFQGELLSKEYFKHYSDMLRDVNGPKKMIDYILSLKHSKKDQYKFIFITAINQLQNYCCFYSNFVGESVSDSLRRVFLYKTDNFLKVVYDVFKAKVCLLDTVKGECDSTTHACYILFCIFCNTRLFKDERIVMDLMDISIKVLYKFKDINNVRFGRYDELSSVALQCINFLWGYYQNTDFQNKTENIKDIMKIVINLICYWQPKLVDKFTRDWKLLVENAVNFISITLYYDNKKFNNKFNILNIINENKKFRQFIVKYVYHFNDNTKELLIEIFTHVCKKTYLEEIIMKDTDAVNPDDLFFKGINKNVVNNFVKFLTDRQKAGSRFSAKFFEVRKLYQDCMESKEIYNSVAEALRRAVEVGSFPTKKKFDEDEKNVKKCDFCGMVSESLKICSRCKGRYYCSVSCQRQDWKTHRKNCKNI